MDRFRLQSRLGRGAFGEVWLATDRKTEKDVAVKLEKKDESKRHGLLVNEYELLHEFKTPKQQQGFAEVCYFGRHGEYVYLVMELLGAALDTWLERCGGTFNVATTMYFGEQILRRLEFMHSRGILHRDVKPDNFMMGVGANAHIVYICDFGLSDMYIDSNGHFGREPDSLTGTARYASINAHGYTQSRRDDLESLGYVLVYFLKGTLPWIGLDNGTTDDDEGFAAICNMKKSLKIKELCHDMPSELAMYLGICRTLSFKQCPNYTALRILLNQARNATGSTRDWDVQWLEGKESEVPLNPVTEWEPIPQPHVAEQSCCCVA